MLLSALRHCEPSAATVARRAREARQAWRKTPLATDLAQRWKSECARNRSLTAVVLHLRSCYVSKTAIFSDGDCSYLLKIEVPLDSKGLDC